MPLARAQRMTLARVLSWSRRNGWVRDAYPNTRRSADGHAHVRFDAIDEMLVVDRLDPAADPLRCRVVMVPTDAVDVAVNVLAALGYIPPELCPMVVAEHDESERIYYTPWTVEPQQPLPGMPEAPEPDEFDGPASFADAGQTLADWTDGRITADRAAEMLSALARHGLIVSTVYHDEMLEQFSPSHIAMDERGDVYDTGAR